jgi:hypothetical protein
MTTTQKNRLARPVVDEDRAVLHALHDVDGYTAVNPERTVPAVMALEAQMTTAQAREVQLQGALAAARDQAAAAEWAFHDAILDVKNQVRAQFGVDSDEVQQLGLKKRSKRKTPVRRNGTPAAAVVEEME